LNWSIY